MGEVVTAFEDTNQDAPRTGRTRKYPWDQWFDGQIWKITHGVNADFQISPAMMERVIRTRASRWNKTARVQHGTEHVGKDFGREYLLFQALDRDEEFEVVTQEPELEERVDSDTPYPDAVEPKEFAARVAEIADAPRAVDGEVREYVLPPVPTPKSPWFTQSFSPPSN